MLFYEIVRANIRLRIQGPSANMSILLTMLCTKWFSLNGYIVILFFQRGLKPRLADDVEVLKVVGEPVPLFPLFQDRRHLSK